MRLIQKSDALMASLIFVTLFLAACSNEEGGYEGDSSFNGSYTETGLPIVYIDTYSGEEISSKDIFEDATIRISDSKGG